MTMATDDWNSRWVGSRGLRTVGAIKGGKRERASERGVWGRE